MKKKVVAVVLAAAMTTALSACGSSDNTQQSASTDSAAEETTDRQRQRIPQLTAQTAISYTIGISQFAMHGSLDNCREGFLEGLKEEGIEEGKNLTVDYKNAEAAMGCGKPDRPGLCIRRRGSDLCHRNTQCPERIQRSDEC